MIKTRSILPFLCLLLISILSNVKTSAQNNIGIQQSIDSLMRSYYLADNPGAAIRVMKDHKLLFESSYGKANLEEQIENTPETIFKIGSMTKQFTAICIMKLVEDKKIALSDLLTDFYPELFKDHAPITIQQMLSHSSGILDLPKFKEIRSRMRVESKAIDLIKIISSAPLEFNPGDQYKYSNSPYIILGGILEQVTGMTYAEMLQQFIFEPLGMRKSYFTDVANIKGDKAKGYFSRPDSYAPAPDVNHTLMFTAGGIWSTVGDLAKWNEALYGDKLISRKNIELAFTPNLLNTGMDTGYGFGFRSCEINGEKSIEHGGGIFGYNSYGIRIESEGAYVIILSNFEGGNKYADLAAQVAAIAIDKPYMKSEKGKNISPKKLKRLTGQYLQENGDTLIVALKNDQLYVTRSGKSEQALSNLGDRNFRIYESVDNRLIFGSKKDKTLIWKPRRGMSARAVRLEE